MTDKIDAATCRRCGQTALFDGVTLLRVKEYGKLDEWECEGECDKRARRDRLKALTRNDAVRNSEVYANRLLERLSCQLSTRTSSLEAAGTQSKQACPKHYAFDIMLPLAHASLQAPLGWVLFAAKYLHRPTAVQALVGLTVTELKKHLGDDIATVEALAHLAVHSYCTGRNISERRLRRALDLGRGPHRKYQKVSNDVQALYHAVENEFAYLVRRVL